MPTVEERLAALEKQMAAWIDQQPTNYYTHQYSGEEIDNAVARALPNGAIDQAAGTFVRPNLLDNWYFGNPVDQKGGYIVPKGVNYYKVDGFVPQGPIPETVKVDHIDQAGSEIFNYGGVLCFVPKDGGYVRGYIPAWNGYSIDRWSVESDSEIVITLVNGGIRVKNTATVARQFKQILPGDLNIAGRMITISALVSDVIGTVNYVLTQVNDPYKNSAACSISKDGLVSSSGSALTGQQKIVFILAPGAEITLLAAKLELGPTQTLAHREGDKWVLNEVPEYGDQLRRCLRHDYILGNSSQNCPIGVGTAYSNDGVVCVIQLPEYMRTNPAVVLSGEVQIRFSATQILTATSVLNYGFSGDKVQLYFPGLSGLTPGQSCDLYTQVGSRLEFNSNL